MKDTSPNIVKAWQSILSKEIKYSYNKIKIKAVYRLDVLFVFFFNQQIVFKYNCVYQHRKI